MLHFGPDTAGSSLFLQMFAPLPRYIPFTQCPRSRCFPNSFMLLLKLFASPAQKQLTLRGTSRTPALVETGDNWSPAMEKVRAKSCVRQLLGSREGEAAGTQSSW